MNNIGVARGKSDHSDYVHFCMENGINVILVHNIEGESEIVLLDIDAGAEYDKYPGVAHFLEHLLFMGTKKYPGKSEYYDFILKCGGGRNGITTVDKTTYFHAIPVGAGADALDEAIDRLSQFFVDPLFNEQCVNDELNVVDSEYCGKLTSDVMRLYQIDVSHANPEHAICCFLNGNKETLVREGVDMRAEVIEFYKKHYVPSNMVLVVYTPRDVETMKKLLIEKFGHVGGGGATQKVPRRQDIQPYPSELFSKILWIKSIQNHRELCIKYIINDEHYDSETKPQMYLLKMLGYSEKGSLFSFLKEQNMATFVQSVFKHSHSYLYGVFSISLVLTDDGLAHYERVIATVLAYIEMLKEVDVNVRLIEELQATHEMNFNTYNHRRGNLLSDLMSMASDFRSQPLSKLVSSRFLIERVDADAAKAFINKLGNNFFAFVIDPRNEEWVGEKERWYGGEYRVVAFERNEQMISEMRAMLGEVVFPEVSKFTVTNLDIKCKTKGEKSVPDLLKNESSDRLWHKIDDQFMVPTARFVFFFKGKYRLMSVRNETTVEILCRLINLAMVKGLYNMCAAGYSASIQRVEIPQSGVIIQVSGYSEKIEEAVLETVSKVASATFDEDTLSLVKKGYIENLEAFEKSPIMLRANINWRHCLTSGIYMPIEKVGLVESITLDEVEKCANDLFGSSLIETLAYGNIHAEEARNVHEKVVDIVKNRYPERHAFEFDVERVRLTKGSTPFFYQSAPSPESCLCLYIEAGARDNHHDTLLGMLFMSITESSFFSELRTKQQLGYSVYQWFIMDDFSFMLTYLLQSTKPLDELYRSVQEFINTTARKIIEDMSEEKIGEYKNSLQQTMMMKRGEQEEFSMMLSDILNGLYDFGGKKEAADMIGTFTKDDLLWFVDERIIQRRSMCIAMISEDRYDDEIAALKDKEQNDLDLTLVYLDRESIARWWSEQKERQEPARPFIDLSTK